MTITKDNYTITELSNLLNVTDHTLRYYEKEFNLAIPRDSRGRRYYDSSLFDIFAKIKNLRDEGFNMKSIKEILINNFVEDNLTSDKNSKQNSASSAPIKSVPVELSSIDNMKSNIYEIKVLLSDLLDKLPSSISTEISSSTIRIIDELKNNSNKVIDSIEVNNKIVEVKLERHFKEIDDSLSEWRKKNKGGAFKQFFQRIGLMAN